VNNKTSKILLTIIALGLWANLLVGLFGPRIAAAQSVELTNIQANVFAIATGTCTNKKIC